MFYPIGLIVCHNCLCSLLIGRFFIYTYNIFCRQPVFYIVYVDIYIKQNWLKGGHDLFPDAMMRNSGCKMDSFLNWPLCLCLFLCVQYFLLLFVSVYCWWASKIDKKSRHFKQGLAESTAAYLQSGWLFYLRLNIKFASW